MKHTTLALCSLTMLGSLFACGGISDPNTSTENIAVVRGALTGDTANVPANTRVAIVWHVPTPEAHLVVGADAPVVNGAFSFKLAAPPANYLTKVDDGSDGVAEPPSGGGTEPGNDGANPATPPDDGAPVVPLAIHPTDGNVSGSIATALQAGQAAFVIYTDGNGNAKLDLDDAIGSYASSPDKVIGGSTELALTYLTGGGTVDYEKLRDDVGSKPSSGYNLRLLGEAGRWLSVNDVSLKLGPSTLPYDLCSDIGDSAPEPTIAPPVACSADGRSYTTTSAGCEQGAQFPAGLCSSGIEDECTGAGAPPHVLGPNDPIPPGWPCPVDSPDGDAGAGPEPTGAQDGGAGPSTDQDGGAPQ